MSRSDWASDEVMGHILAALTPANRLAILTSMLTGLRIGDVLDLRSDVLSRERFTVTEQKTLKKRSIRLPAKLRDDLLRMSGKIYVFESRSDPRKHRTRQAVYKDVRRAAKAFRCKGTLSCHTARKVYAVAEYRKDLDIRRVQRLLNHSSEAVTMLYAMADEITARKRKQA